MKTNQTNQSLVKLSQKDKNEIGGAGLIAGIASVAGVIARLTPAVMGIAAIYQVFKSSSGEIKTGTSQSVKWDSTKAAKAASEKADATQPIYFIY
ncbi:hypothetical protein [Mycoplasma sp. 'Moose RK']|uniref:hypothetical protein n=1 Tax=Mycoplasma sp. 'Moose RK' TaxID=2780095 RepID=UPI0018C335F5|nr:hypothetical protein [Mycoplasma sp. 'Moose RK']MBG0730587.1 hypothetical protein [Mycoplasma sp. 'Moose RK']